MTTSTPPAWHFLHECDAPVTMEELSVHSHNLPVADALSEQNDSDQCANGEQNPPSALIPSDQCDECRAAPGQPHATGCEGTAQLTDSQSCAAKTHPAAAPCGDHVACPECINREDCAVSQTGNAPDTGNIAWVCIDCGQDRYGKPNAVSTWHTGKCGICGETTAVTEPRDFGGYHSVAPTADFYTAAALAGVDIGPGCDVSCGPVVSRDRKHDNLYDEPSLVKVESCPECGAVTDLDYGTVKDKPPDCQAYGEPEPVRFAHETPANLPVGARSEHTLDDNPLLNHMECTFNDCMDTAVAKNEGYAGSADPMANFNDSVRLGVPVPIGVAIRLSDKWARLCRLLQTGENPLADESITDTIMDAVNYLAILLYALEMEI